MIFTGFLLSVLGAILVLLDAALSIGGAINQLSHPVNPDLAPVINVVFLIGLSIISIILSLRMRAVRDSFLPLILIMVAVIIMWRSGFSLLSFTMFGSILILIGAILVMAARK